IAQKGMIMSHLTRCDVTHRCDMKHAAAECGVRPPAALLSGVVAPKVTLRAGLVWSSLPGARTDSGARNAQQPQLSFPGSPRSGRRRLAPGSWFLVTVFAARTYLGVAVHRDLCAPSGGVQLRKLSGAQRGARISDLRLLQPDEPVHRRLRGHHAAELTGPVPAVTEGITARQTIGGRRNRTDDDDA